MGLEADFSQLTSKLEELERKVQKGISDKALQAGGKEILAAQKITVPVKTGKLRDSLIVGKISGSGAKRKILVGINPAHYETVKYGFYQEHGTRVMLGKKWMRRSWNMSRDAAQKTIAESIAQDLGGL